MSGKSVCLSSVLMALLSLGSVQGQEYGLGGMSGPTTLVPGAAVPGAATGPVEGGNGSHGAPAPPPVGHFGLSEWLTYPRSPGCACQLGGNGPIGWDIYVRSGVSLPLGGNYFGKVLGEGWAIEGGARTLFFNTSCDAAWNVDLSIGNVYNDAVDRTTQRTLLSVVSKLNGAVVPSVNISVADLNRTYVGLGFGREWWMLGSAEPDSGSLSWRWGVDAGGRYSSDKLDVNQLRHLTERNGGMYCAVHTDMELPFGTAILFAGLRAEWAYTWSDILQRFNNADVQEILLLVNMGVRW